LKFRSKVKFENILKFLGYDFLYPIFCSKTNCKEVIEHFKICDFSYLHTLGSIIKKNSGHRKLPQTNLRKDLLEIIKLLYVFKNEAVGSFSLPVRKLIRIPEPYEV
jgi:hypothetical protein